MKNCPACKCPNFDTNACCYSCNEKFPVELHYCQHCQYSGNYTVLHELKQCSLCPSGFSSLTGEPTFQYCSTINKNWDCPKWKPYDKWEDIQRYLALTSVYIAITVLLIYIVRIN